MTTYRDMLKGMFPGIALHPEDLLFLEPFQIGYLPERAPRRELAALLRAHPVVHRYLVAMCPSIKTFTDDILETETVHGKTSVQYCDDLLWEVADLIIYSRYPEVYDKNVAFPWEAGEIVPLRELEGKTVVDAGAGPGKLSFLLAPYAVAVHAMEPVSGFRRFIRDKAEREKTDNLFVADGVLRAMPFPPASVDYLITSQAIGWDLTAELAEIERILKPNGHAIHLFGQVDPDSGSAKDLHDVLCSPEWQYDCEKTEGISGPKLRYHKAMTG